MGQIYFQGKVVEYMMRAAIQPARLLRVCVMGNIRANSRLLLLPLPLHSHFSVATVATVFMDWLLHYLR